MGTLIPFPDMDAISEWAMPAIYTPERIFQLARCNAVARQLRRLGYRVIEEDVWPNDEGAPIIQIDTGEIGDRAVRVLAECLTSHSNLNYHRATIDGVRVCWQGE